MKKSANFLIMIVLMVLLCACRNNSKVKNTNWENKDTNQIEEFTSDLSEGNISGTTEEEEKSQYLLSQMTIKKSRNAETEITKYEYDKDGNQIKHTITGYNDGIQEYVYVAEFKYNDKGDQIESLWNSVRTDSSEYEYDDNGDIQKKTVNSYDYRTGKIYSVVEYYYTYGNGKEERNYITDCETGTVKERYYRYNAEGNIVEESEINDMGEVISQTKYEYDNNGKILKTNCNKLVQGYTVEDCIVYKYNEKGNKISEQLLDSNDNIIKETIYEYDKKGNMVHSKTINATGYIVEETRMEYDDGGNLLLEANYSDEIEIIRIECVYDEFNNKIEERIYYNGEERSIAYFEYMKSP